MIHDVLIVGAGLAGSVAAALLGRAGVDVLVVDRHAVYPPDFRAEQLVGDQTDALNRLGLLEGIVGKTRRVPSAQTACYGRLLQVTQSPHYGIKYENLVNAARDLARKATLVTGRVARIDASPDIQSVHLADGSKLEARLVVLATGPNCDDLLSAAGIQRRTLSADHSLSFGFDIGAGFRGIVAYQGERAGDGMDYVVFFPINGAMRANLFTYRSIADPWVKRFRKEPKGALLDVMPGLEQAIGPFSIAGKVQVRPNSIKRAEGAADRSGLVLIGDAYQTPCPSIGLGVARALTDVEALSRLVPAWLATPGMAPDKIRQFYQVPAKSALDAKALQTAIYRRALATETGLAWRARRLRVYYTHRARASLQAIRRDTSRTEAALAETAA